MDKFGDSTSATLDEFTTSSNKYDILGVPPSASAAEIKLAYRRAALLYHPDRHAEVNQAPATAIFHKISAAYQTLSNPAKRNRYDAALARGIELDDDEVDETFSLREILMAVQTQEHAFSDASLQLLVPILANAVRENLITELSEQIVATLPIQSAPMGATCEGTFQSGAMVVTTLRLLFPYWSKLETSDGNVKTIQRFLYMPNIALPNVQQLWVINTSRRRARIQIALMVEGQVLQSTMKTRNVGKILLMCRLWGIPYATAEMVNKTWDRRWLLWARPIICVLPVFLAVWLFASGAISAAVITWCMAAGCGYFQYRMRYGVPTISELLEDTRNRANSATATESSSAISPSS